MRAAEEKQRFEEARKKAEEKKKLAEELQLQVRMIKS